jgi:hypothetical protein
VSPQLLHELAGIEKEHVVLAALFRNPATPPDPLIGRVAAHRDLWLIALGREDADVGLRRAALCCYAADSDASGPSASSQISRIVGGDPDLWCDVVRASSPHASGLVLAASRVRGDSHELRDLILDWLELHGPGTIGQAHNDVVQAIAEIGEHPSSCVGQRRRALHLLAGRGAGALTESLVIWEEGGLSSVPASPAESASVLRHVVQLQHRVAHRELAEALARTISALPLNAWNDVALTSLLGRVQNPLLGAAAEKILRNGVTDALHRLAQCVGPAFADHTEDPWAILQNVCLPAVKMLEVRAIREDPTRTISTLRPLADLCRLDADLQAAAIDVLAAIADPDVALVATALLREWSGTMDELLETAHSLR